jgi:hypothetical protein
VLKANPASVPRSEKALGRADCLAGNAVGDLVRIRAAKVGNRFQVEKIDIATAGHPPAVGSIVKLLSATDCIVQFHGPLIGIYTVTPGIAYFVGTDARPAASGDGNYPSPGQPLQQIGVATSSGEVYLNFLGVAAVTRFFGVLVMGIQDGVNTVFSTSIPFVPSAPRPPVFTRNGVRQALGVGCDYEVSEAVPGGGYDTITMADPPLPGEHLVIDFDPAP